MYRIPIVLAVLLALFAAVPFAQERMSKKKPPTFEEIHPAIAEAFKAGQYGLAMSKTRELMTVITPKWHEAILAALPGAPAGYTIVPQRKQNPQAASALAALTASIGTVVEQKYKGEKGTLICTVTADSPMIQMFGMWVKNPALLGEGAELVKYGEYDALLKKEGDRWSLQIVIGSSLVEAKGQVSDEFLLRMFDQKVVDRLADVLGV